MFGSLIAFRWSRSPFLLIAAIASLMSLALDASFQTQNSPSDYEWETRQAIVVAALGAATIAAGVLLQGRSERDYSTWLFVTGLAALAAGLAVKTFPDNTVGWGVLWTIGALAVLGLSLPLQQRLFAAAGLAAIFAYLAKLVFDVFDSASAALVMALLGLAVLGAGMLYQRFTGEMTSSHTPTVPKRRAG